MDRQDISRGVLFVDLCLFVSIRVCLFVCLRNEARVTANWKWRYIKPVLKLTFFVFLFPRSCILLVWRYTKRQEKESCKKPLDSWRRPENASPMVGKKNKHFPFSVSSFIFLYILVDHLKIRFSQVVMLFLINKHNRHFFKNLFSV